MFRNLLSGEFSPYGSLTDGQLNLLEGHYRLLERWNKKINLTRIEKLEDVVRLHYCESLFLARFLPSGPLRVADVGSGPGFPGIPVAILRPDIRMTLIESHQRKAAFLRESSAGVPNVHVAAVRAQEYRDSCDWVVSRAVSPSEVLGLGVASNFAILLSETDAPVRSEITQVPWGQHRVVSVSRET